MSTGGASSRRVSLSGAMLQTPKPDSKASLSRPMRKSDRLHQIDQLDDSISSLSSGSFSKLLNFLLLYHLKFDGLTIYLARRGLDVAGIPVKKHSFGAGSVRDIEPPSPLKKHSLGAGSVRDIEPPSPLKRQPFSPISSTLSSKANMTNATDHDMHGEKLQKAIAFNNVPFTTPSKTAASMVDEENRTPKTTAIPVPTTPLTMSVPMHMAMTPAPAFVPFVGDLVQEIEYSFEERRAGFVLA